MSKLSYLSSVCFELWLRHLPRVFSLLLSCHSTMFNFSNKTEEVLLRFPHLGEAIIKKLSNADDSKLREVSRTWQKFVDTPRIFDWRMSIRGRFMMILLTLCPRQLIDFEYLFEFFQCSCLQKTMINIRCSKFNTSLHDSV